MISWGYRLEWEEALGRLCACFRVEGGDTACTSFCLSLKKALCFKGQAIRLCDPFFPPTCRLPSSATDGEEKRFPLALTSNWQAGAEEEVPGGSMDGGVWGGVQSDSGLVWGQSQEDILRQERGAFLASLQSRSPGRGAGRGLTC